MRIGIIGLGAIGGVVAQRVLARKAPDDVIALAAGRHAAELRNAFPGAAVWEALPEAAYDLILLATRTDATRTVLERVAPLLARDGAVVCLQNGLPEDRAARVVGPDRVLGAVIGWSATREGDRFVVTGGGKFTLGGASRRLGDAKRILERVFPVKLTKNLQGARWSKLALNCAMSTLGAVSGLSLGELVAQKHVRVLALAVLAEAVEVARSKQVKLERVAGFRPDLLVKLPAPMQHVLIRLAALRRPSQRSGMIARLEAGRPAGVEDLNALVDRPLNRKLVELVHAIERKEKKIDPRNLLDLA